MSQLTGKEKLILKAKGTHGIEYYISVWDGIYLADCSTSRNGSKAFMEFPRVGKSIRGCKTLIAKIIGEKLKWEEA